MSEELELRKRFGLKVQEGIGIEDQEIKEVIQLAIEIFNKYIDICKIKEQLGVQEDRSLKLRIVDVPGETGFVIIGCRVKPVIGIERVTTEVELTKDVFWAILTKKISLYEAWMYDLVKFKGEYSLRDAQILIPLFETLYDYLFGEGGGSS